MTSWCKFEKYYEGGGIERCGMLKNGEREGNWREYYMDGTLKSRGYYENGIKCKKWKYYWGNNQIKEQGYYVDGVRDGPWKYYYNDFWIHIWYKDGVEESVSSVTNELKIKSSSGNYKVSGAD